MFSMSWGYLFEGSQLIHLVKSSGLNAEIMYKLEVHRAFLGIVFTT